jgi:hypothetical protein
MDESLSLLSPEEEELARKYSELGALELEASAEEAKLDALRSELEAFEGQYLKVLGPCFSEMEELRMEAASKHEEGDEALSCASASQREDCPPGELKLLFREVAKNVHPDLAANDEERRRRDEMMAHANAAYADGNPSQLRDLLLRWKADPDAVEGEGVAFDLVRVVRRIARVRSRMGEIRQETRDLRKTDLYFLRQRADRASAAGRDLLQEMRANLTSQIEQQRQRVARMH